MNENLSNASTIESNITSKSPVWRYFKRIQIKGVYRAQCLINQCPTTLSIPNCSTTSLFKHLKHIHKITNLKKNSNGRVVGGRIMPKLSKAKKKKLDRLALAAIVKDGRSFNDFHKSGIKQFLDIAIPGYKPIHRNTIHRKLGSLYARHYQLLITRLSTVSDIGITVDFWSNRKFESFMVLTGHFVTEDFESQSTILQFSMFDQRHYSHLIGREIEKQLINLNIFHKVTTITCDNAPNMIALFQHLTRPVIHIPCMAHIIHLILCNGLGIWAPKRLRKENSDQSIDDNSTDSFDNDLSQSITTIDIDKLETSIDQSSEEEESDSDNEVDEDEVPQGNDDEETSMDVDCSENDDDDYDPIDDNFHVGLSTDARNAQEKSPSLVENQIRNILQRESYLIVERANKFQTFQIDNITHSKSLECRELVSTVKYSNVFRLFTKELVNEYNNNNEKKIQRSLQIDVKSRWNSTFYVLESIELFRPIIDNLLKNVLKMNLTRKQVAKLMQLEMSNNSWDAISSLVKVLEPFQNATKFISASKYPTVGYMLFFVRKIEQKFVELIQTENNEFTKKLRELILKQLEYYTSSDEYRHGFSHLILHAYFDPYGLSVLTQREISSIERQLKSSHRHSSTQEQQNVPTSTTKPNGNALRSFLDSIDNSNRQTASSSGKTSSTSFTNEIKKYRQLAISFASDEDDEKTTLIFWRRNKHLLPNLAQLARKYLATPATSVASESAFSKSAYYGRKERANLQGDNLAQSIFLKDKLFVEKQSNLLIGDASTDSK